MMLMVKLFGDQKLTTVRTVLMLAVFRGWPVHQLDITNAFLHGSLAEPVYFEQPSGFLDPAHPDYVCRLKKALYGLRHAPRAWFQKFASHVSSLAFIGSKSDTSLLSCPL